MKDYIVWDLETSGLKPGVDKIIEIGMVIVRGGEVTEDKSWLLNHGIQLSDFTTELTGITQEMVDGGRVPQEAYAEFLSHFDEGLPNLTHNGWGFDMPFLFGALDKELYDKYKMPMVENMIDTAAIYKGQKLGMRINEGEKFHAFANRVMNIWAKGVKYNIPLCCEELGVSVEGADMHRASSDATLTHYIYQKLVTA